MGIIYISLSSFHVPTFIVIKMNITGQIAQIVYNTIDTKIVAVNL